MDKDAYYFSHDSNSRNDEKIVALRMKYGWDGYGLFWAIIERLRESCDYTSVCDYNLIAYDLRSDSAKIKSIINDFGLFTFTDDGKRFYSKRLKQSMFLKEEKSNKAKQSAQKRWDKVRMQCDSNANAMQVNESKVKKNIEKEREARARNFYGEVAKFAEMYPKQMLRQFYDYWTEPNKSLTKMKFELEKTWDLGRRLNTWASRDREFSRKGETTIDPVVEKIKAVKQRYEKGRS